MVDRDDILPPRCVYTPPCEAAEEITGFDMDLQQQAQIVRGIHDTLNDFIGQRIKVRANMGRSKIVESEGTLMQVHPQLFVMEVHGTRGRTSRQSFQYADVLTGTVELTHNGEPIFEPFVFDIDTTDATPSVFELDTLGELD